MQSEMGESNPVTLLELSKINPSLVSGLHSHAVVHDLKRDDEGFEREKGEARNRTTSLDMSYPPYTSIYKNTKNAKQRKRKVAKRKLSKKKKQEPVP